VSSKIPWGKRAFSFSVEEALAYQQAGKSPLLLGKKGGSYKEPPFFILSYRLDINLKF
jgi:hypothetical protein